MVEKAKNKLVERPVFQDVMPGTVKLGVLWLCYVPGVLDLVLAGSVCELKIIVAGFRERCPVPRIGFTVPNRGSGTKGDTVRFGGRYAFPNRPRLLYSQNEQIDMETEA
jgi:hypothetical protein